MNACRLEDSLYLRARILKFWLIDIPNRTLEVYTSPSDDGYDHVGRIRAGETVRPVTFGDLEIRIEDVVSLD